jgi:hypothetical protein
MPVYSIQVDPFSWMSDSGSACKLASIIKILWQWYISKWSPGHPGLLEPWHVQWLLFMFLIYGMMDNQSIKYIYKLFVISIGVFLFVLGPGIFISSLFWVESWHCQVEAPITSPRSPWHHTNMIAQLHWVHDWIHHQESINPLEFLKTNWTAALAAPQSKHSEFTTWQWFTRVNWHCGKFSSYSIHCHHQLKATGRLRVFQHLFFL